jgi:hypothetical protein
MRRLLLLAVVGCSHAAQPSPTPPAPQPSTAPPTAAPPAPVAETAPAEPAFGWTACVFAKSDLVARKHGAVKIVPDGGYLLVVAHIDRDDDGGHAYIGWLGLASLPGVRAIQVQGMMDDSMSEFGHRGGVSTSYEIHGSITSSDGKHLDMTLESQQQPHMFDPDSPLHHLNVAFQQFDDPVKCKFKTQTPP